MTPWCLDPMALAHARALLINATGYLDADLDEAISAAVAGLWQVGYSWAEIGTRLGVTRQAAQQRWGGPR